LFFIIIIIRIYAEYPVFFEGFDAGNASVELYHKLPVKSASQGLAKRPVSRLLLAATGAHQYHALFIPHEQEYLPAKCRGFVAMKFRSVNTSALLLLAFTMMSTQAWAQDDAEEAASGTIENPTVVITTSLGEITLELYAEEAPASVENFISYANEGFYEGTVFHRVISHFMIQGGGMTEDLKPKATREPVVNEANNGISNTRGTVAMARTSDPDSATSQFFINVQDNGSLDYNPTSAGYTVFGRVTEGMEVVDDIRFVETTSYPPYHDVPVTPVIIESVEVVTAE